MSAVLAGVPGAILTGHASERLPSVASFCFPGTSGESVLLELERQGVVCSSGSACAAGSDAPSAVLTAMGISRRGGPDGRAVQLRRGGYGDDLDDGGQGRGLGRGRSEEPRHQLVSGVGDAVSGAAPGGRSSAAAA